MSDGYTELAQLAEALQEAPNLRQIAAQRNKQGQHSFAQLLLPHVHRYAGEVRLILGLAMVVERCTDFGLAHLLCVPAESAASSC
jgi:hypothetical protein